MKIEYTENGKDVTCDTCNGTGLWDVHDPIGCPRIVDCPDCNGTGQERRQEMKDYKCKKCEGTVLEEVLENSVVVSVVSSVKYVGECKIVEYGEQETIYGEVLEYRCAVCGLEISETEQERLGLA